MLKSLEERAVAVPLPDHAATERLGADLALAAKPGDCIHLYGDLGAGKTTLARGFVRAMAEADIEVPSPTFTIVQSYDARVPLLHADLYRIEDAAEIEELGFDEALETSALLVEWPERGGDVLPAAMLCVELEEEGDGRVATLSGPALDRYVRSLEVRAFLSALGKPDAARRYLTGDASARSYELISDGNGNDRVLMNAPAEPDGPPIHDGRSYSKVAHLAENVRPFVAVAEELRREGLGAPRVYAADLDAGLLLVENLGAGSIVEDGKPLQSRYEICVRQLADMHRRDWSPALSLPDGTEYDLPPYDRDALKIEVSLLADWYARDVLARELSDGERNRFNGLWDELIDLVLAGPQTLLLRDFHSPNIVWREDREGAERVGLIDFQDAVIGPEPYDLASLAQDARVDIPAATERALVAAYCDARWPDRTDDAVHERERFERDYAIMAAQRASKILGIFVRLDLRDGKPDYRAHLPRMRDYIGRSLRHPALAELADFYRETFEL